MIEKELGLFGDPIDEGALEQMMNCLADHRAVKGALMADHHRGYAMPIGGVVAYDGAISVNGVGYDIACGNKAVRTEMLYADALREPAELLRVMKAIQDKVEFGIGRSSAVMYDDKLFDSEVWKEINIPGKKGEPLKQKARAQLGTVGSGNHYVDLLVDERGYIWIAVHFGSRGFGHTIASGFIAVARGKTLADRVPDTDEPAILDVGSPGGDLYIEAMHLAGEYAYAGRNIVVDQVLEILGNPKVGHEVHCHHNFAWLEDGLWVVRKGATPLTNSPAFIGGSMGDISVIVRGKTAGGPMLRWCRTEDIGALDSAPHGAGRQMSRTKAAGKWKKVDEQRRKPNGDRYTFKRKVRDASTGLVDWPAVQQRLKERGIVVLGSGADEAPEVYKDLTTVLGHHSNIEVETMLRPIGVVMAGDDTFDPYAD